MSNTQDQSDREWVRASSERIAKYKPACECFDNDKGLIMRAAMSSNIATHMGDYLFNACETAGFCRKSLSFVLDDVILHAANSIAIGGTIIECASVEAEVEVVRVLTGMEARLIDKVRMLFAEARVEIAEGKLPKIDGRGDVQQQESKQ